MSVEKVSVSLDKEMLAQTRERVGRRGISGYVNDALRRQLRRDVLAELLAEMRELNGPVSKEAMEEVRLLWPSPEDDLPHRPA
jgi:Arc/MetJ family transcription regulator